MNQKILQRGPFVQLELPAAAGITPGMLIEEITAGTVQAHATSAGYAEKMFAQEDALQGRTVADAYVATDPVSIAVCAPGSRVLALMKAGHAYTKGQHLMSNGDGTLIGGSGSQKTDVAVVVDAIDLSASGAINTLTSVRVC